MPTLIQTYRYQGRHRAPPDHTTARRAATVGLLVAATGSTLTVPASAGPGPNWDPVLDCESDWRNVESYNASSASGYFQIIDSTWAEFGGLQFAPRAIQASRAEQEVVADRLFERRGLKPWKASEWCWGPHRTQILRPVDTEPAQPRHAEQHPTPPAEQSGTAIPDGYRVRRGDTLSKLAARFQVPGGYREVAKVNNIPNPNIIRVGQRLR